MKNIVTKEILAEGLRNIGLKEGDECNVQLSMKAVGWINGGERTLLEAFTEALGESGTLIVQTHSMNFFKNADGVHITPYDGKNGAHTGRFPNYVMNLPEAHRSAHPSHSSAAIGRRAVFYTENHEIKNPFGRESTLNRLYRENGKVLLLGVSHTSNTILHLAETLGSKYARTPAYREFGNNVYIKGENGETVSVKLSVYPGCSNNFNVMDGFFKYHGISREGYVGSAYSQLLDAKSMVDFTVEVLKNRPDFLLCPGKCGGCEKRRKLLIKKGIINDK